jgi:SAM-dependent methyltransferase
MGTIDYRAQYDDYWSRSDRIGESSSDLTHLADQIVMHCGLGSMLDIGSGEGQLVAALLRRGADAHGVDVSNVVIARCNKRIPERFTCGSVLALPYLEASFDTVVSTDCMEHLAPDDVPKALAEIHRVAKRYVFLQLATTRDRDGHWHLTVEGRGWWEARCLEAGFRKHPAYYKINPYESLNRENWQIVIPLEKIPASVVAKYPLSALAAERDLHMDMLREIGERSDAHVVRYHWASAYVKPGDRVLDAACGLGYGSHVLRSLTKAASVSGIDVSDFAIGYAATCFPGEADHDGPNIGTLPEILGGFADGSFELVVSFETLEHLDDPEALISEFCRVLSPGGRLIVSVPNDWSDESGIDPNPFHLQVYNWQRLKDELSTQFILECAFAQTASQCKISSKGNAWERRARSLHEVDLNATASDDCEWWLMVGMKTPCAAPQAYTERVFSNITASRHPSIRYGDDYINPWLLHSMVNAGLRLRNTKALEQLAQEVLVSEDRTSNDYLAALCVKAYRILEACPQRSSEAAELVARISDALEGLDNTPVRLRWKVSLLFVLANLQQALGKFSDAKTSYVICASHDVRPYGIHLATKTTEAWYAAGKIASALGNRDEAKTLWRQGVEYGNTLLCVSLEDILINPDFPNRFNCGDGVREYTLAWDSLAKCANGLHLIESGGPSDFATLETCFASENQWLNNDLLATRGQLVDRTKHLQQSQFTLQERTSELVESRELLTDRTNRLEECSDTLLVRTEELVQTRETLVERTDRLKQTSQELVDRTQDLVETREALAQSRALLEQAHHQLEELARELALARDELSEQAKVPDKSKKTLHKRARRK